MQRWLLYYGIRIHRRAREPRAGQLKSLRDITYYTSFLDVTVL